MHPSPAQRSAFAVATFLAYAAQTVDAYVPEGEELKLQTPTDYLWAALKVGLAFSPIIAIGAIVGCAKEDDEVEKAKSDASEGHSCKT